MRPNPHPSAKLRFNFETAKRGGAQRSGAERQRSGSGEAPNRNRSGGGAVKIFSAHSGGWSYRGRANSASFANKNFNKV